MTIENGESGASVRAELNAALDKINGTAPFVNNIDVTGTVTADGLTSSNAVQIEDTATKYLQLDHGGAYSYLTSRNDLSDGGLIIRSYNGTAYTTRFKAENNGDISFYEDTGTTPKFFWDASAEALGIGTSNPSGKLHVAGGRSYLQSSSGDQYVLNLKNPINTNGVWLGTPAADSFAVYNEAGAERLRIDASGNVLVGKTTTNYNNTGIQLFNAGYVHATADGAAVFTVNRKTSDGDIGHFRKDGTLVGSISVTASSTSYNTSSDYRLKDDVQPLTGASDRVLALKPSNFAWKADGSRTDGFIAHEVQEVAPYAVTGEKDGEDMQAMDHSKLVPLLTAALQEALTEIASLKARLDAANL